MERQIHLRSCGYLLFLGVLAGLLGACGCSSDNTTQPVTQFAPPTNLTYLNDESSIYLSWTASPDVGSPDGYAVYRDSVSMSGLSDTQLASRRRNATLTHQTSYQDPAQPGKKWYYAVRGVKSNGDLSNPTNEVNTAARPLFAGGVIGEFSYHGVPSGLECSTGQAWAMRSDTPDNRAHIDVYLGTTDNQDALGSPLVLKSPHLVLGGSATWSARVAGLKLLGSNPDTWDEGTTSDDGWQAQVELGATSSEAVGKVIAVRVPQDARGQYHYAKIRISAAEPQGGNDERSLEVEVAYQPLPNYIRFATR